LGVLVFAALVAFFAWHSAGLLSGHVLRIESTPATNRRMLLAAVAALAINWIYRWSAGFDR
jgi:uncharacterized membrane protein